MRERGLKLVFLREVRQVGRVAPHAGAWIETMDLGNVLRKLSRSPCGSVD